MKTLITLTLLLASTFTYSQFIRSLTPGDYSTSALLLEVGGKRVDTLETSSVLGSPYITNSFRMATIVLKNGMAADSVPLKFNAYYNEMHVILKGELVALNNVKTVIYLDDPADTTTWMVFSSGYPKFNYQDTNTFYQIVAGSEKLQLLKLVQTRVNAIQIANYSVRKEFKTDYEWFVYSEKHGMERIRSSKKSIIKALPSETNRIEEFVAKHQLTFKNIDDVIKLIELLGQ